MADYDRVERREVHESPFQTLSKQVAGIKIQNGDNSSSEVEDEPKVVDSIESLCISCEEN
ncbi:MAG: hypothetical protein Q9225_003930, partial [Loekoesia sp. 1 TL-2023]